MSEAASSVVGAADVLAFWRNAGPDHWFTQSDAFDAAVRAQFLATYEAAVSGKLAAWERTAEGALSASVAVTREKLSC